MLKISIAFIIVFVALLVLIVLFLPQIERILVYWPVRDNYFGSDSGHFSSYQPLVSPDPDPFPYSFGYWELELMSLDNTKLVAGISKYRVEDVESDAWLIYFHGNASNFVSHTGYVSHLQHQLQVNVLLAEYRGFYKSEGKPTEKGILMDAQAQYNYLIDLGVAPKNIILYGFSLGSGVATDLASKVEVGALILEAPYTSVPDAAQAQYGSWLPVRLIKNRFESIKKIALIDAPLFVMHGRQDKTIPFELGQKLFDVANEPKIFREFEGNHQTLFSGGYPEIATEIRFFLEQQSVLQ